MIGDIEQRADAVRHEDLQIGDRERRVAGDPHIGQAGKMGDPLFDRPVVRRSSIRRSRCSSVLSSLASTAATRYLLMIGDSIRLSDTGAVTNSPLGSEAEIPQGSESEVQTYRSATQILPHRGARIQI